MLRFTFPLALWGLLAIPILLLIYRLLGRARIVVVSSLFLWMAEKPAAVGGARLQKMQRPLLLFLEILVILLLILAAAQPLWRTTAKRTPVTVVLDDSYSMLAGTPDVRSKGLSLLEEKLDPRFYGPVRYVRAGREPQPLEASAGNDMTERLSNWTCQQETADLGRAMALARAMGGPDALVWVLTDHAPPSELENTTLRWQALGEAQDNLAIVNGARRSDGEQDRLLLEVANWGTLPKATTLLIGENGEQSLTLGPGEVRKLVLNVPAAASPLTVRLAEDPLAFDNESYFLHRKPSVVRTQIQLRGEALKGPLIKALGILDHVHLVEERPHLVFTDRPVEAREGTWVCEFRQGQKGKAFVGPFVTDLSHPITDGIDLGGIVWGASAAPLEGDMRPLILVGNQPLLSGRESVGTHVMWHYNPEMSTLHRSPNWPIMIMNLVQARASAQPGMMRIHYRLGESATIRGKSGDTLTLYDPGNDSQDLSLTGSLLNLPLSSPGIYSYEMGRASGQFALNAFTPEESDLRNAITGEWGNWLEHGREQTAWRSLVPFLLLLALATLLAHWYVMCRFREGVGA